MAGQTYGVLSGANGSVVIPANVGVVGIAARAAAGVVNATVEAPIGSEIIAVPAGGGIELSPPILPTNQTPTLLGPATIRFVNTAGYIVETLT